MSRYHVELPRGQDHAMSCFFFVGAVFGAYLKPIVIIINSFSALEPQNKCFEQAECQIRVQGIQLHNNYNGCLLIHEKKFDGLYLRLVAP